MKGNNKGRPVPQYILYLDKDDPRTAAQARNLLRGFDVDIRHRSREPHEGTVLPWLITPYGNFYGLDGIEGFIDYEPKLAKVLHAH